MHTRGLLFDFIGTGKEFESLKYSKPKDTCHIILTSRLFATPDESHPCAQGRGEQKRLHIRAAIFGFPSVISTSGIVEGPAKPKEYYLYKQKYAQLGAWEREEAKIKQKLKGRFIDFQDKRMSEVLKGYIAQALFFYISGEPFCVNKSCRLYNAHWQEELITSQVKSAKFCPKHQNLLKEARLLL